MFCWPFCTCTYQFLFCYFCSAILFHYFCSTGAFSHLNLNQFLFCYFCSTGAFFCSAIFVLLGLSLFRYFCSAIFVPLFLFCWGFFLFRYFCSAIFVPLFLFCYFCFADLFALALTNFCSAIFVPLFLFCWGLFALKLKPIFVPLFLFHYFCSTGAFFCSAIFVLLTFLHLHLPIFVLLFLFCWGLFALKLKPIFVPLFLFHWGLFLFCYFCSAIFVLLTFLHLHLPIFVPLFLFRWGLFALKPHLPHYLIDNFCSADSVHQFLFSWPFLLFRPPIFVPPFLFCSPIFVPLTFFLFCPPIFVPPFLFHSPIFVLLTFFLFCPPIFVLLTFLHLHCPHQFLFGWLGIMNNFCSAIFVPPFLFHWPFCTWTWGPRHPMAESPHQFLFRNFCSADLFALSQLGVPITQWSRVPTNFCSTW